MPEDKPIDDSYISHQLSLTFIGPQTESESELSLDKQASFKPNESDVKEQTNMRSVISSNRDIVPSVIDKSNSSVSLTSDRYLFVDLETGGLYPDKHAVLQVAAVITDFDFNIKGQFMSYIQPHPELEVNPEALAINKLDLEHLKTAPPEKAVATTLAQFTQLVGVAPRFVGYNCQFDLEFLAGLWERHDLLPAPYRVPWLDIYAVAKTRLGPNAGLPNFKLISVATHFGLSTDGAHDALADIIMTVHVAKQLKALAESQLSTKNGNELETAKFSV